MKMTITTIVCFNLTKVSFFFLGTKFLFHLCFGYLFFIFIFCLLMGSDMHVGLICVAMSSLVVFHVCHIISQLDRKYKIC